MKAERDNSVVLGFLLGLLIGVPLVTFGISYFADNVTPLVVGLLLLCVALGGLWLAFVRYRNVIFLKLIGAAKQSTDDILDPLRNAIRAIARRNISGAINNGEMAARAGIAKFVWIKSRQWMISTIITAIIAFAGLIGSALLVKQNSLLETQNKWILDQSVLLDDQNKLIREQNILAESSRRSALVFELSSILDKIDKEADETKSFVLLPQTPEHLEKQAYEKELIPISPQLTGRSIAISRSLRPYRSLGNEGALEKDLFSPERSQLLISLIYSKVDLRQIIDGGANFEACDLPNARFDRFPLSPSSAGSVSRAQPGEGIKLRGGRFNGSNFYGSVLLGADFTESKLRECNFDQAYLVGASFVNADLSGAKFNGTHLPRADSFAGANLNEVCFMACPVLTSDWLVKMDMVAPKGFDSKGYKVRESDPGKFVIVRSDDLIEDVKYPPNR